MKKQFLLAALIATSLTLPCEAGTVSNNLLLNGNGENSSGSPNCSTVPVPGWTTRGTFTVGTYNGRPDVLQSTSKGPPNFGANSRGRNFFCGGNSQHSSAEQVVNLASSAKEIDTGKATYDLSGWLGGDGTSDDNATLVATFNDQHSTPLKVVKVGPVKASDRFNLTSLVFKKSTGIIPVGTRSVNIALHMQRVGAGILCDGYADNLSFKITKPAIASTTTTSGGSTIKISGTTPTSGGTTSSSGGRTTTTSGTTAPVKGNFWTFATTLLNTMSNPQGTGTPTSTTTSLTGGSLNTSVNSTGGGSVFATGSGSGSTTGVPTLGTPSSSSGSVEVQRTGNATTITVPSSMLFSKFSSSLNSSASNVLSTIKKAKIDAHSGKPIALIAHTNESTTNRINLGLATKRALSVANWLDTNGISASNLEVRGFGHPQSSNNKNRVEIVLLDSRNAPTSTNLSNISGSWKSTFGTVTLVENGGQVTGHWVTPMGQKGKIDRGTFDPSAGRIILHYSKAWEGSQGNVTFNKTGPNNYFGKFVQVDKNGNSSSGSWQIMR